MWEFLEFWGLRAGPVGSAWGLLVPSTLACGPLLARLSREGRLVSPMAWLLLPFAMLVLAALQIHVEVNNVDLTYCGCSTLAGVSWHGEAVAWSFRLVAAGATLSVGAALWQAGWAVSPALRRGGELPWPVVRALWASGALCLSFALLAGSLRGLALTVAQLYVDELADVQGTREMLAQARAWSAGLGVASALFVGALAAATRVTRSASRSPGRLLIGALLAVLVLLSTLTLGAHRLVAAHATTAHGAWTAALSVPHALPRWPKGMPEGWARGGDDEVCVADGEGWACHHWRSSFEPRHPPDGTAMLPAQTPLGQLFASPELREVNVLVCEGALAAPEGLWERAFPPALAGCRVMWLRMVEGDERWADHVELRVSREESVQAMLERWAGMLEPDVRFVLRWEDEA